LTFGHASRWLSPYAEGVLPPAQAGRVAHHVLGCRRCRRKLDAVREGVRFAAALRPAEGGGPPSWGSLAPLLEPPPARAFFPFSLRWAVAAAALVAVVAGGLLARPSAAGRSLEAAAVAAHRAPALEVRSSDPGVLTRWIAERTGFSLTLPAPSAEHALEGAGLVPIDGGQAVVVAARLGGEPVTLLVADARAPAPTSGAKRITTRLSGDLNVATWLRGPRSYALVSSQRGEAACTLCHAGPALL
jgi:anti-sigma factor RsiW